MEHTLLEGTFKILASFDGGIFLELKKEDDILTLNLSTTRAGYAMWHMIERELHPKTLNEIKGED
jgi:hypothetical protein